MLCKWCSGFCQKVCGLLCVVFFFFTFFPSFQPNTESFPPGTRGKAALLQGKDKIKLLKLSKSIVIRAVSRAVR